MKKFIVIAVIIVLSLILGTLSRSRSKIKTEFDVIVEVNSKEEIQGIHYEYYLDDTAVGGAKVLGYENKNVKVGEKLYLTFEDKMFPENANLNNLKIEIFIIETDQTETLASSIKIDANYGSTYNYVLTGDPANYTLKEK